MENVLNVIKSKYELVMSLNSNLKYEIVSFEDSRRKEKIIPLESIGDYSNFLNNNIFRYMEFEDEKEKKSFEIVKIQSELKKDPIYSFVKTFRLNKELRDKRFTFMDNSSNIILLVEDLTKYRLTTFLDTIKKTNIPSILYEIKNDDIMYHALYVSESFANIFNQKSLYILKNIKEKHPFEYLSSDISNKLLEETLGKEANGFQTNFTFKYDEHYFKTELSYIQIGKKMFVYATFNDITNLYKLDELSYELNITRENNVKLERENLTDALTGLGNEALYVRVRDDLNNRIKNGFKEYAILVCDVNGIKITNDTYGHEFGCYLIVSAGHTFPKYFKTSHMFHVGGDEFIIIVEGEDFKNLPDILKRIRNMLDYQYMELKGIKLRLSVAIGSSYFMEGDIDYKGAFGRADKDMYKRKQEIKTRNHIPGR